MSKETATYLHGHHESVLRSHAWRTAENSAAYLLPELQAHSTILDVGCGPGTITTDLAAIAHKGHVTAVDRAEGILEQAAEYAAASGVEHVDFEVADVHELRFEDDAFDVVHAHQVLQHVGDPVQALREMRRVATPGGVVAVRDSDYRSFTWYPESDGLTDWLDLYERVARASGGEPDAGRRLKSWALKSGFREEDITATSSTWTYSTPHQRKWWSELWADRALQSGFATQAVEGGHATRRDLEAIAQAWRSWGAQDDGWLMLPHGELLCRV
ncbi:class I SAM-dependent methyltransferase [Glycomyces tarimensis]